jgi:hypothetical protein
MKQPPRRVAAFVRESVFLSRHIEQEGRLAASAHSLNLLAVALVVASAAPVMAEGFPNVYMTR